jgi:hypothetical protein
VASKFGAFFPAANAGWALENIHREGNLKEANKKFII